MYSIVQYIFKRHFNWFLFEEITSEPRRRSARWHFCRIAHSDGVRANVTLNRHVLGTSGEKIRSAEHLRVFLVLHSVALERAHRQLAHLQRTRQLPFSATFLVSFYRSTR